MGGRIASQVADPEKVAGCVCLGYPFHPPGKPDKLRTEHLKTTGVPTLILQGERDPFGNAEEVVAYDLSKNVLLRNVPDGDHSFQPRKSSTATQESNLNLVIESIADFIRRKSR